MVYTHHPAARQPQTERREYFTLGIAHHSSSRHMISWTDQRFHRQSSSASINTSTGRRRYLEWFRSVRIVRTMWEKRVENNNFALIISSWLSAIKRDYLYFRDGRPLTFPSPGQIALDLIWELSLSLILRPLKITAPTTIIILTDEWD